MFSVKITGNIFFVPAKEERESWNRKNRSVQLRKSAVAAVIRAYRMKNSFAKNRDIHKDF